MDDRALADRLVSYADARAAASFLGLSALSLALGDPDIRCQLVRTPIGMCVRGGAIVSVSTRDELCRLASP